MRLQLSEETFCALAKSEYPQIAPPLDVRPESIKKAMEFKKTNSKQDQKLRNIIRSLEKNKLNTRRVLEELSVTISPEQIRAIRNKNKTEMQKLVKGNHAKLSLDRLRYLLESGEKEKDLVRAKRKRKNTKLVGRKKTKRTSKQSRSSLRNDIKERRPKSTASHMIRHTTPDFQYRRSGPTSHTATTTLHPVYQDMTLPAGYATSPQFTVPERYTPELFHHCNVTRDYCLLSYETGVVCGRTVYYRYNTFDSFCIIDYVNCREGFDFWVVAYPGRCIKVEPFSEYMHYPYQDDYFMDRDFVIEDIF